MAGSRVTNTAYKNPPITEAVIGIHFKSPVNTADIDSANSKFSTYYLQQQIVSNFNVHVDIPIVGQLTQSPKADVNPIMGYRHSSDDMTELLVLWQSDFVLSQLAPYQGWDSFFERFARDWKLWKRVVGFREIARIGVRYINRIDIPATGPLVEYEKFLNIYPKLPNELETVNAYAVQTVVSLVDIDCQLLINSAIVPSPILNHISVLLDLDISKENNSPQKDEDIFALLNTIRSQKNKIFEACVSDQARELFQK